MCYSTFSLLWSVSVLNESFRRRTCAYVIYWHVSENTVTCVKLCIKRVTPLIIEATNACPRVEKLCFHKCRTVHIASDITGKCLGLLFSTYFSDALEPRRCACLGIHSNFFFKLRTSAAWAMLMPFEMMHSMKWCIPYTHIFLNGLPWSRHRQMSSHIISERPP